MSEEIDAIVAGNSHAGAIQLSAMGLHGSSSWIGGSDLFETAYQVESLMPRLPKLKFVFICISYFSFNFDNKVTSEKFDRSSIRWRHYAAFKSWKLINGDFSNFLFGKLIPIVRQDHWEGILLQTPDRQADDEVISHGAHNYMSADDLTQHAHIRVRKVREVTEMITGNNKHIAKDAYASITSIIPVLKAKNIRIVFFTPPYYHTYTEFFDTKMIAEMNALMNKITHRFEVEYYDFSRDQNFSQDPENYFNSDHLSAKGRIAFSLSLMEKLSLHNGE